MRPTLPSYFCPISHLVNFISSHVVPFSARFEPFSLTSPTDIGTTGTTNNGSRKDGFKTFTAQIVIKKAGLSSIARRKTFDRTPAVNAWIVKRSAELKGPGDLEGKAGPTLSAVIDRYIAQSNNPALGTKAQVLFSRERT